MGADCTCHEDKLQITKEIEDTAYFGYFGWHRLHCFMDELLHCSLNATNVHCLRINTLIFSSRCKFRLIRIVLYPIPFLFVLICLTEDSDEISQHETSVAVDSAFILD